jgi:RND family efflux transporter MFP subunit
MKPSFLFLPFSVLLLSSCGSEPARRTEQPQTPPVTVQTAAVATADWPANYEATGTIRARVTTTISSKVTGYVQRVNAQVGDHVREGQPLIALEARDLEARVRSAEAARTAVESAIPEAENAAAAAKANLDLEQATFHRMEELAAKKSISDQEFDEASARLKAAQANYQMALSRRTQLNSKMAQADQDVRAAGIMLDYAKLAAPFSGVIITKTVETGNLATPGAPLLTVEQDGLRRLEAAVDESKLASVRVGQRVEVVVEASGRKLNARVSEIVPSVDSASRTYTVKLDLPATPQFRTGMFGRAIFPLGAQKVVAVPVAAVMERGQLQSVFVVEDGMAHTRPVTTGRGTGNAVEVLAGLSAGEKVVMPVPEGLRDGARVEVRQ